MEEKSFRYDALNPNFVRITPNEYFTYRCTGCGNCCRNNRNVVMLENIDAYYLARYLNTDMTDIYSNYTEPIDIGSLLPCFTIKTVGSDDSCIFLKNNRCSIQQAKPRTCRLYPLSVEPMINGEYRWYLCKDRHKFTPKAARVHVKTWIKQHFHEEDKQYYQEEIRLLPRLSSMLKKMDDRDKNIRQIIFLILKYRYFLFDVKEPFLPQLRRNNLALLKELKRI